MIYNQAYPSTNKNQVLNTRYQHFTAEQRYNYKLQLQQLNNLKPIPNSKHPVGALLAFNPARTYVLNAILVLARKHRVVYACQEKIGNMANVSPDTAWKEIKVLTEMGYIAKVNRGANKTCLYKVSEWFNDRDIQQSLSKKLAIFFCFSLALLKADPIEQNGRINIVFNFIYKTTTQDSSFYGKTNAEILMESNEAFEDIPRKPLLSDNELPEFMRPSPSFLQNTTTQLTHDTALPREKEELLRYLQLANDNLKVMTSVANPPWRSIERIKEQIKEYEAKLKRM